MEPTSRRDLILGTVADLAADLLYYDRKGDEELPVGVIEAALESGEISIEEIALAFTEAVRQGLKRT